VARTLACMLAENSPFDSLRAYRGSAVVIGNFNSFRNDGVHTLPWRLEYYTSIWNHGRIAGFAVNHFSSSRLYMHVST